MTQVCKPRVWLDETKTGKETTTRNTRKYTNDKELDGYMVLESRLDFVLCIAKGFLQHDRTCIIGILPEQRVVRINRP